MRREARRPQSGTCGQDGRMHSNTLAAKGDVTKATDGTDSVTRRKKSGYGKRANEEQPLTVQRQCRRARPASRGSASVDGATQTAKDNGAAIPDVHVTAYGKDPPQRRPPALKGRNKTGAQNRLARAAKQPQSQRPCLKHMARGTTAVRSPKSWLKRKFAFQ